MKGSMSTMPVYLSIMFFYYCCIFFSSIEAAAAAAGVLVMIDGPGTDRTFDGTLQCSVGRPPNGEKVSYEGHAP